MSKKILVAIPAFNCEKEITKVLRGFTPRVLDAIDKVVIINNRSTDKTVEVASQKITELGLKEKIAIYTNEKNYNLGGSQKIAFIMALKDQYDYVAILHGDNQAKTEEILRFLEEAAERPNIDAFLGSRFMKSSELINYSFARTWGNRVLNVIFSIFSLHITKDLGSGLNLFKTKILEDEKFLNFEDSMTFNIDILLYLYGKHYSLKFLPITWTEEGQVSNARNFKVASSILRKLFSWRLGRLRWKNNKKISDYQTKRVF